MKIKLFFYLIMLFILMMIVLVFLRDDRVEMTDALKKTINWIIDDNIRNNPELNDNGHNISQTTVKNLSSFDKKINFVPVYPPVLPPPTKPPPGSSMIDINKWKAEVQRHKKEKEKHRHFTNSIMRIQNERKVKIKVIIDNKKIIPMDYHYRGYLVQFLEHIEKTNNTEKTVSINRKQSCYDQCNWAPCIWLDKQFNNLLKNPEVYLFVNKMKKIREDKIAFEIWIDFKIQMSGYCVEFTLMKDRNGYQLKFYEITVTS